MQKVRGQALQEQALVIALPQLVGKRFQILFHSPHRGSFHLSLTVLCAIGHKRVFSLGRWSFQIPTRFLVSRGTWEILLETYFFRLQDFHLLWCIIPDASARNKFGNSMDRL
jgi:hypothetical protein